MAELEFGVGFKMDEISWAVVVSTTKQTCARSLSQWSVSRASRVPKPGDCKGRKMDGDEGRRRLGRTCAGTLVESVLCLPFLLLKRKVEWFAREFAYSALIYKYKASILLN